MTRNAGQRESGPVDPALQLEREEQVGQLALPVRSPRPVAALGHQVVEVDRTDGMQLAGHGDDPAHIGCRGKAGQQ